MDFLEIIARQLGVGSEQPEIVSSVTCGDTSILAASAHQTFARGLGIVDACCLTRCLDNPRISYPVTASASATDKEGSHFSTIFINFFCLSSLSFSDSICLSRFFLLLQPRFHQRHAFHLDSSSGSEPSWGINDTTPSHLPPPRCSWTSWRSCRRSEIRRRRGEWCVKQGKTKDEFHGWSWNMLWWFVIS